jgi:thiol-disulfide isomerase/thioredoxin
VASEAPQPRGMPLSRRSLLISGVAGLAASTGLPRPAFAAGPAQPFVWPDLRLLDGSLLPAAAWHDTAAVLVFWATHCPYCRRHNAHVDKLHRSLAGRPVRLLTLAGDRDAASVQRYMAANGYGFAVSLDGELLRQRLNLRRTIPTTLTIGRQGRVGRALVGEMFEDDVLELAAVADRG